MKKLNIGVIGYGFMGRTHSNAFRSVGQFFDLLYEPVLKTVCARNAERGSAFAEPEIRKLANKLLDVLQAESPNLFGDYTRVPLPDGTFEVQTPFKKV